MKLKHFSLIFGIVGLSLLAGCFSTEEASTQAPAKQTAADSLRFAHIADSLKAEHQAHLIDSLTLAHKLDSLQHVNDSLKLASLPKDSVKNPNGNNGGWDDFPNKYKPTLQDLATNARQLPVPMGTRYGAPTETKAPNGKVSAAMSPTEVFAAQGPCTGTFEVYGYKDPLLDYFIKDTLSYFDSAEVAHCSPQGGSNTRETHIRYIMDLHSGESWENLQDKVTDQDVLPRHTIHGTGHFRLNSGQEFIIQSYDVVLITQFGNWDAFVLSASMKLLYKDGYNISLDLVKAHPYKAVDFFPVGALPDPTKIMSGPITRASAKGVDTVGFIDLFGDRTIRVRDWAGERVAP